MFRPDWNDPKKRSVRITAAVLLVLVLGSRFGLSYFRPADDALGDRAVKAAPTSATIAVLPFTIGGDSPNAGFLADALATMMTIRLDGAGDLHRVDPQAVAAFAGSAAVDSTRGREVAAHFHAPLYVLGNAREPDVHHIHLEAALYDANVGLRAISVAQVEGRLTNLSGLIDELANQLVGQRVSGFKVKVAQVAIVTSESLPALKFFFSGERALQAGQNAEARAAFAAAALEDPLFALAHYRHAISAVRDNQPAEAAQAMQQALLLSNRLPEHDRQLINAQLEEGRGADEEAERLYRAMVEAAPDDWQAWLALADLQRKLRRDDHEALGRALALVPAQQEIARRTATQP